MRTRNHPITNERVDAIINELNVGFYRFPLDHFVFNLQIQFFPKENPIYSVSGCKQVAQKVDLFYAHERDAFKFHEHDANDL